MSIFYQQEPQIEFYNNESVIPKILQSYFHDISIHLKVCIDILSNFIGCLLRDNQFVYIWHIPTFKYSMLIEKLMLH